jgi:hypothetical protein
MLRRLALAFSAFALFAATPVRAADPDYSDIWWAAGGVESGWGVNFAQGPGVIFATFFIYGPDKQPVWYVSSMVQTGAGRYSGALSRVTGTWFGGAWQPTDATETIVGEAQFVAENVQRGVFTYRVDLTQVVKTIERQPLTAIDLAGTYLGGVLIKGSSGCNDGAYSEIWPYQYIVTQEAESFVRIEHINIAGYTDCVMRGKAVQLGKVFHIADATYVCESLGINTAAVVTDLRRTSNGGIEATWKANLGGSCVEDGRFTAIPQE